MPITKLNPYRSKQMCDCIKMGGTYDAACRAGGIDRATLYRWLKRGESGAEPYATFCSDFKEAYNQSEIQLLAVIKAAAMGKGVYEKSPSWQAAAWMLERARGYNRSGAAGLPLKEPPPVKETIAEERYRLAKETLEDSKTLGLSGDRLIPVIAEYLDAKQALKEEQGEVGENRADIITALKQIPRDLIREALGEE